MTTFERRQQTLDLLRQQRGIRVPDLARALGVSEGTVRNDLTYLEQTGALTRVRGGAVVRREAALPVELPPTNGEAVVNHLLKSVIARWAADMVDDGDSILLDASTTVRSLAPYLLKLHNLTVVTHSIETALELAENPTHTVILLGGVLRASGKRVLGHLGEANLEQLHVKTAFLSCVGLSPEAGLTESDYAEAQLKRKMIASADRVVALVDSSKFGVVDLTSFATVGQIDRIFTDSEFDPMRMDELRQMCGVVTVCSRDSVTSFSPCEGDNRHVRIGFANLTETGVSFAIDVRRGLESAAKEAGNIDLVLADNQLDGEVAMRVADELVARQVDLAIEYQIDEKMGSMIVEKFRRANIPVIAVDIPMLGATYFGVNNYSAGYPAGEALGRWICDQWGGRFDRLLILREERAGPLIGARMQGQLDGLSAALGTIPADKIIDIDSGNTAAVSEAHTKEVLRQLPESYRVAFICINDDAAVGAIAAARGLGREKNTIGVGQGGDRPAREELRRPDSLLLGTSAYMPEKYGVKLLELTKRLLAREALPPAIYCDHVLLTRENINRYYPEPESPRG